MLKHPKLNYLDSFLKHIIITYTQSNLTESSYRHDMEKLYDYLEDIDLLNLDQNIGFAYVNALYEMDIASSSIARKISALRSFMKFLQLNYGALLNPFNHITVGQQAKKLANFLMFSEIEQLVDSC